MVEYKTPVYRVLSWAVLTCYNVELCYYLSNAPALKPTMWAWYECFAAHCKYCVGVFFGKKLIWLQVYMHSKFNFEYQYSLIISGGSNIKRFNEPKFYPFYRCSAIWYPHHAGRKRGMDFGR